VLSILGLARIFPMYLTAISIIALGAVLLFQGATVAWHFSDLLHQAGASKAGVAEVGGGITTEFIARDSGYCPWRPGVGGNCANDTSLSRCDHL
jgi:hypothetical protein